MRLVVVCLLLGVLILVPALACTGSAGPAGPKGDKGDTGPAGPAGAAAKPGLVPTIEVTPNTLTQIAGGMINPVALTITGAGWTGESVVYVDLIISANTTQTVVGAVVTNGAFTAGPSATNMFEIKPGTYTMRGTGKDTAVIAYTPFTVKAAPPPATTPPATTNATANATAPR